MPISLEDLANEVLENIVRQLPTYEQPSWRAIPTPFLLLNRRLNYLLMHEQVRHLHLNGLTQLKNWLNVIEQEEMCTDILRYRNLLDKVYSVEVRTKNSDPMEPGSNPLFIRLAEFLWRCPNLRRIHLCLPHFGNKLHILEPVFRRLPSSIQSIKIENWDGTTPIQFRILIDDCIPRLPRLRDLVWRAPSVPIESEKDIIDLFKHAPRLKYLEIPFVEKDDLGDPILRDSTIDAVMAMCPELINFHLQYARNISDSRVLELLKHRMGRVTSFMISDQSYRTLLYPHAQRSKDRYRTITDGFLDVVAKTCPKLREISLVGVNGFSTQGLHSILKNCKDINRMHFTFCETLEKDPVWKSCGAAKMVPYASQPKEGERDDRCRHCRESPNHRYFILRTKDVISLKRMLDAVLQ